MTGDNRSAQIGTNTKIRAAKRMKEIMTSYYIDAKTAGRNGRKVAWITSGGPVEPLIAMDVIPVYPENYAAMTGAARMGADLCGKAELMGYSSDLCSYARSDIACAPLNGGPIGGLPRPDFLVCCNNICGTVLKWYEVQARYFNVPVFIFDTPFIHGEMTDEAKRYVIRQMEEYFVFLEERCGARFDHDRMREVSGLGKKGLRLWQDVLDTMTASPAPMTAFDSFFHMGLIVTLRGTQTVVDYYTELLDEMRERIACGMSIVANEKYRLVWDNLPLWYRTRWLSDTFASHDACLVADTYTSAWSGVIDLLDEKNYIESMAVAYSSIYINISIDKMYDILKKLLLKYRADGLVMHSNRSCKPYSLGQYDLRRRVMDELGIPVLIIEADMVDERAFNESQIGTRIEAFMEMLSGK